MFDIFPIHLPERSDPHSSAPPGELIGWRGIGSATIYMTKQAGGDGVQAMAVPSAASESASLALELPGLWAWAS